MKKIKFAVMFVVLAFLSAGCASPYVKAEREYFKKNPVRAEEIITPVAQREEQKDGRMKNLYLWDLGVYRFSQGKYQEAIDCFKKSVTAYEKIHGTGQTITSTFTSASSQQYVGDPVEVSMAYLYIGLSYLMLGDYESALVGLRRSLEEDISKDEARHGDMGITNFVMGECYSKLGEYDNAVASYRRAINHAPDLLPAYVGCYYALRKQGDMTNAPLMLEEIEKRASDDLLPSIMENEGRGIVVIMLSGRASRVTSDMFLGAFRKRVEMKDKIASWVMYSSPSKNALNLSLSDRMHEHFKDQGGLANEAKHQTTRLVVGSAMKQVPCLGLFAPSTEADIRYWPTMPGYVYIGYCPTKPGEHDVTVKAYDKKQREITRYAKSWRSVDVKEKDRTLLITTAYEI